MKTVNLKVCIVTHLASVPGKAITRGPATTGTTVLMVAEQEIPSESSLNLYRPC
jgi:hypothetical protein